jgi:uncharacterized protein (TIRG00374 family)
VTSHDGPPGADGVGDASASATDRHPPSRAGSRRPRPWLRPVWALRLAQVVAAVAVLRWLALPRLGDTGRVLGLLDDAPAGLLATGAALGVGALAAYAQVTRSLLAPGSRPRLHRAFGVVVTSVGVNRIMPFGAALGSAVMFRLLTKEGPGPAEAGVALSVQAVGSALALQLLLWPSLLLVSPGLLPAAVVASAGAAGVAVIGFPLFVVWALVVRPARTAEVVGALVVRLRGPEARVRAALVTLGTSVAGLVVRPRLLSAAAGWSILNWLLDAASLWAFLWALGAHVPPTWVLVAFALANLAALVPLLPGGFGVVETTMAVVLTSLGADPAATLLGIAAYRLVDLWLPVPSAALSYALLRLTRRAAVPAPPRSLPAAS